MDYEALHYPLRRPAIKTLFFGRGGIGGGTHVLGADLFQGFW